jgi:regulator of sirC expression with transglutaminase-like and TPR domain
MSLSDFLQSLVGIPDDDVPVFDTAIHLAALDHPGISIDRYLHYGRTLSPRVRERLHDLRAAGADDDARTHLAALKFVLYDTDGFVGDTATYDDVQNADLMRVIDRRMGLPITLAILYMHAAQGAGLSCAGLNFPGHFLVRLDHAGQMIIFDPFSACAVMGAPELRALIKRVNGNSAELQADYYTPLSNRGILTRLQNNLKLRLITNEDYSGALRVVERMRIIDPTEYRLLFDAGILYAKLGHPQVAITALKDFLDHLPPRHPLRPDAQDLLAELLIFIHQKDD